MRSCRRNSRWSNSRASSGEGVRLFEHLVDQVIRLLKIAALDAQDMTRLRFEVLR
jgi:hypothetical protein